MIIQRQKAISAIIVTIMLLVISTSLIGVFYVFSSTITSSATSSGSAQTSQLTSQLAMCMRIDNINGNKVDLRNCGKGVIENKSLVVTMGDVKLGASTQMINEGESGTVNVTGLWQIAPGTHNLKISNGATFALALVDVQPNKDGLVGRWDFDEGQGNKASDDSGNGNVGTLLPSGSEPQWVNGKFAKGLSFDGSNDYVAIPDSASLNIYNTDKISVQVWFKMDNVGNTADSLVDKIKYKIYAYDAPSWNTELRDGYQFAVTIGGTVYGSGVSVLNQYGTWHHIVGVYDGINVKIYVDGKLGAQGAGSGLIDNSAGSVLNYRGIAIKGMIDEVRIWNRALAPDETVTMKQII